MKKIIFILLITVISLNTQSQENIEFSTLIECVENIENQKKYPVSFPDLSFKLMTSIDVIISNSDYFGKREIIIALIKNTVELSENPTLSIISLDKENLNKLFEMELTFRKEDNDKDLKIGKGKLTNDNFRFIKSTQLTDYDTEIVNLMFFIENNKTDKHIIAKIFLLRTNETQEHICEMVEMLKTLEFTE